MLFYTKILQCILYENKDLLSYSHRPVIKIRKFNVYAVALSTKFGSMNGPIMSLDAQLSALIRHRTLCVPVIMSF